MFNENRLSIFVRNQNNEKFVKSDDHSYSRKKYHFFSLGHEEFLTLMTTQCSSGIKSTATSLCSWWTDTVIIIRPSDWKLTTRIFKRNKLSYIHSVLSINRKSSENRISCCQNLKLFCTHRTKIYKSNNRVSTRRGIKTHKRTVLCLNALALSPSKKQRFGEFVYLFLVLTVAPYVKSRWFVRMHFDPLELQLVFTLLLVAFLKF